MQHYVIIYCLLNINISFYIFLLPKIIMTAKIFYQYIKTCDIHVVDSQDGKEDAGIINLFNESQVNFSECHNSWDMLHTKTESARVLYEVMPARTIISKYCHANMRREKERK